jgi:hypothetical protein
MDSIYRCVMSGKHSLAAAGHQAMVKRLPGMLTACVWVFQVFVTVS